MLRYGSRELLLNATTGKFFSYLVYDIRPNKITLCVHVYSVNCFGIIWGQYF